MKVIEKLEKQGKRKKELKEQKEAAAAAAAAAAESNENESHPKGKSATTSRRNSIEPTNAISASPVINDSQKENRPGSMPMDTTSTTTDPVDQEIESLTNVCQATSTPNRQAPLSGRPIQQQTNETEGNVVKPKVKSPDYSFVNLAIQPRKTLNLLQRNLSACCNYAKENYEPDHLQIKLETIENNTPLVHSPMSADVANFREDSNGECKFFNPKKHWLKCSTKSVDASDVPVSNQQTLSVNTAISVTGSPSMLGTPQPPKKRRLLFHDQNMDQSTGAGNEANEMTEVKPDLGEEQSPNVYVSTVPNTHALYSSVSSISSSSSSSCSSFSCLSSCGSSCSSSSSSSFSNSSPNQYNGASIDMAITTTAPSTTANLCPTSAGLLPAASTSTVLDANFLNCCLIQAAAVAAAAAAAAAAGLSPAMPSAAQSPSLIERPLQNQSELLVADRDSFTGQNWVKFNL